MEAVLNHIMGRLKCHPRIPFTAQYVFSSLIKLTLKKTIFANTITKPPPNPNSPSNPHPPQTASPPLHPHTNYRLTLKHYPHFFKLANFPKLQSFHFLIIYLAIYVQFCKHIVVEKQSYIQNYCDLSKK